jgi:hypothetical protein
MAIAVYQRVDHIHLYYMFSSMIFPANLSSSWFSFFFASYIRLSEGIFLSNPYDIPMMVDISYTVVSSTLRGVIGMKDVNDG